jgi:hypothetical protein
MAVGSFLFLKEQIKGIIIINALRQHYACTRHIPHDFTTERGPAPCVLQTLFAEEAQKGEVASEEHIVELARLAAA